MAVAVSLVLNVAAVWAAVGLQLARGSASPEQAATELFTSIADRDWLSALSQVPDGEARALRTIVESYSATMNLPNQTSAHHALADVLQSLRFSLTGEVRVEQVGERLAKVHLTGMAYTLDADSTALARLVIQGLEMDPLWRTGVDNYVVSLADVQLTQGEVTREHYSTLLPASGTVADGVFLMAVKDGSRWTISPLLTAGEYVSVATGVARGEWPDGGVVGESAGNATGSTAGKADGGGGGGAAGGGARGADSPTEAGRSFVGSAIAAYFSPGQAASGTGSTAQAETGSRAQVQALASQLPEDERRFVQLYGASIIELLHRGSANARQDIASLASSTSADVRRIEVVPGEKRGGKDASTMVRVSDVEMSLSVPQGELGTVQLTDQCGSAPGADSAGSPIPIQNAHTVWSAGSLLPTATGVRWCSEKASWNDLGVTWGELVAVQEDGRWFVSPMRSLAELHRAIAKASANHHARGDFANVQWPPTAGLWPGGQDLSVLLNPVLYVSPYLRGTLVQRYATSDPTQCPDGSEGRVKDGLLICSDGSHTTIRQVP